MFLGGEKMPEKKEILSTTAIVQVNGTNIFATIPAEVRSVLKPKKGDKLEFVIFSDRSIEVRVIQKDGE